MMTAEDLAKRKATAKIEHIERGIQAMLAVAELSHQQCLFALGEVVADVLRDSTQSHATAIQTLDWVVTNIMMRLNEIYNNAPPGTPTQVS